MKIAFHYVKNEYHQGNVNIEEVDTKDNIADIFTKALPIDQFEKLRGSLLYNNEEKKQSVSGGVSE
jgi:hypothetical protein